MAKELIRLAGLSKFYTGGQSVVVGLNNLELRFRLGEFVAVTGESGSGKSTLSHVLGGILPYESGEMFFDGEPTSHFDGADWERYRRDNISFISQNYGILLGATVLENVVSALLLTGMERQEAGVVAEELLRKVELWDLRRRRAAKLSSGQKQRLAIARALAKPAPVLIADEPTGNLDPENSEKVIRLLAQAARERLVILVTHEFSEAEHVATRHIVMQDGRVVMDAQLREAPEPEPVARRSRDSRPLSLYVTRLQMKSRPVWSVLMGLFFALTAFAVFAFLGTFIVHLDDSYTRVYDDSAFRNGNQNRIVVSTMDGRPMTAQDYEALVNAAHVQRLETNGYVTDMQYAYRDGVDYKMESYETTDYINGFPVTSVNVYAKVYDSAPFLQTVPVLPRDQQFLTDGRLPENFYEVVAQGDAQLLGRKLTVYIRIPDYWAADQTLPLEVTVVGVTDTGSGLYFHEDVGRMCVQVVKTSADGYTFLPVEGMAEDEFRSHLDVIYNMQSLYYNTRDSVTRQQARFLILPLGDKVFANINNPGTEGEQTLHAQSTEPSGYYLWHCMEGMYLQHVEFGWVASSIRDPNGAEEFILQLYPVGDTRLSEDGTLTDGEYVLWSPTLGMAISSRYAVDWDFKRNYYDAVPVVMEDGVLTGYTQEDIWDVKVLQDQYVSISHDGTPMVAVKFGTVDDDEFSYCWLMEEAKTITGIHDYSQRRLIEVSPDRFDQLTWSGGYEQVSLFIEDYGYMDRVLEEVQGMGYAALSVYQVGSVKQDETLAQEREQTLLICLLALIAVVALQVILLRAMFHTQMESYRLLSNIGLTAGTACRSVLWQVLAFTAIGQILSIAALAVCWSRGVERIAHIIRYLPPLAMAGLLAVHLAISLLAALWVVAALRKQVFTLAGRDSDLPLDEAEEAVS